MSRPALAPPQTPAPRSPAAHAAAALPPAPHPAAPQPPGCVPKLIAVADRALRGDPGAIEQFRLLGETLALVGGAAALLKLQGALHDHAVERWGHGSRGDLIGTWWEHIPAWTAR